MKHVTRCCAMLCAERSHRPEIQIRDSSSNRFCSFSSVYYGRLWGSSTLSFTLASFITVNLPSPTIPSENYYMSKDS